MQTTGQSSPYLPDRLQQPKGEKWPDTLPSGPDDASDVEARDVAEIAWAVSRQRQSVSQSSCSNPGVLRSNHPPHVLLLGTEPTPDAAQLYVHRDNHIGGKGLFEAGDARLASLAERSPLEQLSDRHKGYRQAMPLEQRSVAGRPRVTLVEARHHVGVQKHDARTSLVRSTRRCLAMNWLRSSRDSLSFSVLKASNRRALMV